MKHDNEQLRRATLCLSIQPARRNRLREFKGSGQCSYIEREQKVVPGMVRIVAVCLLAWAIIGSVIIYLIP